MNTLNVNYKDKTVAINYHSIIIDECTYIAFLRAQDNDCKFLCQYLEANRITYEKKEREAYTEIKADTNLFDLDIAIKHPVKSSEIDNNLYKAICHCEDDIIQAREVIAKFEDLSAKILDNINAIKSRLNVSEYDDSINNVHIEILEFTRCKQLEIVVLTKEQLNVSRGTLPVVDELKIAYHVSELFSKDDYRKLLYIQEHLNNKSKLSKQEEQYLDMLWNLNDYEYPEVVKEVEAIGQKKFNEYYDKALKFVKKDEDLKENIEEKLNKFYQ